MNMQALLQEVRRCARCRRHLQPNPVLSMGGGSRIVVIGQAPGRRVHETGTPWNDKSGDNLRRWLGVDREVFYDTRCFGIMPMGFCYPGKGGSGDLPPRPECAPLWHARILEKTTAVRLVLPIGRYAQDYYLKDAARASLAETVRAFRDYLPAFFPLPHPSPRNNQWMAKHRWFESEVLPELKRRVAAILAG
jgi:uracil-DNA glycosylase